MVKRLIGWRKRKGLFGIVIFCRLQLCSTTVEEGDYGIFVLEGEVADVHELVVCRRDAGRGFPIRMLDGAQDKAASRDR